MVHSKSTVMNRKDLIFAAIALCVIGLFVFLSVSGRHGKDIVDRPEHAGLTRETPHETCWQCHAPDSTVAPMPVRHPKKGRPPDQKTPCYLCHKFPQIKPGTTAALALPSTRPEEPSKWQSLLRK
jgi:hypothetical protein